MLPEKAIKTGVVGFGYAAKTFHIPFLMALDEFELAGISSSKCQDVAIAFPDVACYSTPERLFADSAIDLVIITAPNKVHFDLAYQALLAGKHVIVEKPFVLNSADGQTLVQLAKTKGLLLSVFQNRRFDGDFLTVKKLLKDNTLGAINSFESHFDRFRPTVRHRWRELDVDGGGILWDLAPHLIDQTLLLFGLPQAITAQCKILRKGGQTIDYFHMVLSYPDKQVILHADMLTAGPNLRFKVSGDKGTYVKYGLDMQEDLLKSGVAPESSGWLTGLDEPVGCLYSEESRLTVETARGRYQDYFKDIALALTTGSSPAVTAEQALSVVRLIEHALVSSKEGRSIEVTGAIRNL